MGISMTGHSLGSLRRVCVGRAWSDSSVMALDGVRELGAGSWGVPN